MQALNSISRLLILCSIGLFTMANSACAEALETPFQNLDQMARTVGITGFRVKPRAPQLVKIAILDNGFRGYKAEVGKTLPSTTQFHAGPIAVDPQSEEAHGLFMAQIVAGLLDKAGGGTLPVELHLFSAYGYSNLKAAVDAVVAQKFDVVLYSQVWEYGGNGDGRGFINTLVSQATAAGVIWVNAAGNFADATYLGPVIRTADDWAKLPAVNNAVRVRCQAHDKNTSDTSGEGSDDDSAAKPKTCHLRAVLSWNDFKDDVNVGTDKDLDLVLTDDTLKIVQSSGLVQKKVVDPNAQGESLYPREIIEADIQPGLYNLRVKIRSNNFNSDTDVLRITTSGDYIQQQDITAAGDTLLSPADNASVITVGATDSTKSSKGDSQQKPELSFASAVKLKNGETYKGTSNSAAIAASGVVILKAYHPDLKRSTAIAMLRNGLQSETGAPSGNGSDRGQGDGSGDGSGSDSGGTPGAPNNAGLPLSVLGFGPTGPGGCFLPVRLPVQSPGLMQLLSRGAVGVMTTMGPKVSTAVDPLAYLPGWRRTAPDDILIVSLQGFHLLPRSQEPVLSNLGYEVTQLPQDASICGAR